MVLCGILVYGYNMNQEHACKYACCATIIYIAYDILFMKNEGMSSVDTIHRIPALGTEEECDPSVKIPCPNKMTSQEQDYLNSGLHYDHNKPGYYLLCNGEFKRDGLSFEDIDKHICGSKVHDIHQQHNFNIKWSPHTHVGKARGYLNPDKVTGCCDLVSEL